MISRFRIEGEHANKQELIELLSSKAAKVIEVVNDGRTGSWECTDDVVGFLSSAKTYRGRMVLVYRGP